MPPLRAIGNVWLSALVEKDNCPTTCANTSTHLTMIKRGLWERKVLFVYWLFVPPWTLLSKSGDKLEWSIHQFHAVCFDLSGQQYDQHIKVKDVPPSSPLAQWDASTALCVKAKRKAMHRCSLRSRVKVFDKLKWCALSLFYRESSSSSLLMVPQGSVVYCNSSLEEL